MQFQPSNKASFCQFSACADSTEIRIACLVFFYLVSRIAYVLLWSFLHQYAHQEHRKAEKTTVPPRLHAPVLKPVPRTVVKPISLVSVQGSRIWDDDSTDVVFRGANR